MYAHNTKELGAFDLKSAISSFEKKFREKTANKWCDRANFVARTKKYDYLEVDHSKDADALLSALPSANSTSVAKCGGVNVDVEHMPSKLDKHTANLISILFDQAMYVDAMQDFDIDTRRMPLGALTSAQVERGVEVLAQIEDILRSSSAHSSHASTELVRLTSRFYSVLPHDFGRRRPPVIDNTDMLQRAFDKCNVLLDIEKATKLMEKADGSEAKREKKRVPHPRDAQYESLHAGLELVHESSVEYRQVLEAFESTRRMTNTKLLNVWRVNRHGEESRFAPYKALGNARLLWHGTNIAVVAAILSSGLRIMPHSGGRCGKGIYLASECGKSQQYTSPSMKRKIGCMFLAEAALGREYSIVEDAPSLVRAPKSYDSVVARGCTTPAKLEAMMIDGRQVLLPSGKPRKTKSCAFSCFSQDEYLVYREEQVRLRYVVSVKYEGSVY